MHPKEVALLILLIIGVPVLIIIWHTKKKRERQEVNRILTEERIYGVKYDKIFKLPRDSKYMYHGNRHFRDDIGCCLMKISSNKFLHIILFLFLLLFCLILFRANINRELSLMTILGWVIVALFVAIDLIYFIVIITNQHICFYKQALEIKTINTKASRYEYKDILSINLSRSDMPFLKLWDCLIITRDGKRHQISGILFYKVKSKITFWQEHLA